MFVTIHALQTVPPSCINRDDSGTPKSAVMGGVRRHRVSSQAWKRVIRESFPGSVRTAHLERLLADLLGPEAEDAASTVVKAIKDTRKDDDGSSLFLSASQLDAVIEITRDVMGGAKPDEKRLNVAMLENVSVDQALFGRMVAGNRKINIDAACQVAHAIGIGELVDEFDFFTAMDDHEGVASMLGTVEFCSSTLYRYAAIDVDALRRHIGAEALAEAVRTFVRAFVTSMPTGRQNSFAHRTLPSYVMIEVRDDQPISYSDAFLVPVAPEDLDKAPDTLRSHARLVEDMYGLSPIEVLEVSPSNPLNAALDALGKLVR